MKLLDVLRALNENGPDAVVGLLDVDWEESVKSMPADWDLLKPPVWQENRVWTGCQERCDGLLANVAEQIAAHKEWKLLAWHCHRLIFDVEDYEHYKDWTLLEPFLNHAGEGFANAFFLWLALGAAPRLRAQNTKRGIADSTTRATLADIGIAQRRFARYNDGAIGIAPHLLRWHRLVASGNLHRVGRFEYIARPFRGRLRAFRHRKTRQVQALSLPDVGYNGEGYFPYSDETAQWNSVWQEDKSTFTAHPISPCGYAIPQTIELSKEEWIEMLKPDDLALEIHIPEGESLSQESCVESFAQAIAFYKRHYPEYSVNAFVCYSWLFNTQFETLFGPHSNIVKWQHEVYLFPMHSTGKDGLYFVFGQFDIDPSTAPRDTHMRRSIADFLEAGNRLRNGAMFFLFEDLAHYGKKVYRTQSK